ncbi:MAG: OmpH family outer membrane protein, partial [Chitinophagia bacterium]|nr:OmpH family outer membrane protein [Chitinophagia bacterium]
SNIMYANKQYDITADVIAGMNDMSKNATGTTKK